MNQRLAVMLAAFALGMLAWPVEAQPAPSSQPSFPVQQPLPDVPPSRTTPESAPETPPPPFPPMPSRAPSHRWVDVGSHRVSHHRPAKAHRRIVHSGKSKLRQCRRLTHRQQMRSRTCRDLLKHHRVATHRHHTAKHHHVRAKHHRSAHHRRSARHRHVVHHHRR